MDKGVELQFADGKFVVDSPIAALIREATDGKPQNFEYKAALKLVGPATEKRYLREIQRTIERDHLRQHGI